MEEAALDAALPAGPREQLTTEAPALASALQLLPLPLDTPPLAELGRIPVQQQQHQQQQQQQQQQEFGVAPPPSLGMSQQPPVLLRPQQQLAGGSALPAYIVAATSAGGSAPQSFGFPPVSTQSGGAATFSVSSGGGSSGGGGGSGAFPSLLPLGTYVPSSYYSAADAVPLAMGAGHLNSVYQTPPSNFSLRNTVTTSGSAAPPGASGGGGGGLAMGGVPSVLDPVVYPVGMAGSSVDGLYAYGPSTPLAMLAAASSELSAGMRPTLLDAGRALVSPSVIAEAKFATSLTNNGIAPASAQQAQQAPAASMPARAGGGGNGVSISSSGGGSSSSRAARASHASAAAAVASAAAAAAAAAGLSAAATGPASASDAAGAKKSKRRRNANCRRGKWNEEEDRKLKDAVPRFPHQWKRVAECVGTRTPQQCLHRWRKSVQPGITRGRRWRPEEDELLRRAVAEVGPQWSKVKELVPSRSDVQCRERWVNILNPKVCHDPWTHEEDLELALQVKKHGRKWCVVCKDMRRSRTDYACRKRWEKLERIGELQALIDEVGGVDP